MEIVRLKGARPRTLETIKLIIAMAAGNEAASVGKSAPSTKTNVLVSAFASIISGKTLNDLIEGAREVCTRVKDDSVDVLAENAEVVNMSKRLTDAIYGAAGRLLSPELNHPSEKPDITKMLQRVLIEHRARMDPEESKQDVLACVLETEKKVAQTKLLLSAPIGDKTDRASRSKMNVVQTQLASGLELPETASSTKPRPRAKKRSPDTASIEDEVVVDDVNTEGSTVTIATASPSDTENLPKDTTDIPDDSTEDTAVAQIVESNEHVVTGVVATEDSTDADGNAAVTVTFMIGEQQRNEPRDHSFANGVKLMSAILNNDVAWQQYNDCELDRIRTSIPFNGAEFQSDGREAANPSNPHSDGGSQPPAKKPKLVENDRALLLKQLEFAKRALAEFDQAQNQD